MENVRFNTMLTILAVVLLQVFTVNGWPEDCGKSKSHNFRYGGRMPNDKILYTIQEVKPSSMFRKQSYDLTIPSTPNQQVGVISYIEVIDQLADGSGACAYLNGGGPGSRFVTLHIKSQRGEGVNFIINVFGS